MSDDLLERPRDENEGFVLRPEALREITRGVTAARGLERERGLRRAVTIGGGWAVAAMFAAVATAALGVMWHRPVPKDRFYFAIQHDDGTYEPAVLREDLPRNRADILFRHSVYQYVLARENYTWNGINANYRLVSAMSAPAERDRYQAVMLDAHNPANPAVAYGDGPDASTRDVTSLRVTIDPASPFAVDAVFMVKVVAPNKPDKTTRYTARMTWEHAENVIPADVQEKFDPAGIAFTHYSSTPDPDAAR